MLRSRIKSTLPSRKATSSQQNIHDNNDLNRDASTFYKNLDLYQFFSFPRRKRKRRVEESHTTSSSDRVGFVWIGLRCVCLVLVVNVGCLVGEGSDGDAWKYCIGWSSSSSSLSSSIRGHRRKEKDSIQKRGSTTNTTTIDNYYSRRHVLEPVPLIVGGYDGSGTRAFVRILEELNVPMVIQDRGTMDVHGKEMYNGAGWPALVKPIINLTHSASYDLKDLPTTLVETTQKEVAKFLKSIQKASRAIIEKDQTKDKKWSRSVLWGFKAPVSILVLPFFREQLRALKVLHIVRDGRDIALSDNHSPVDKFYSSFYSNPTVHNASNEDDLNETIRCNIKSIQLWNDWNRQVYEYGVRYSDGESLDMLVMRTEDLIHYPLESLHLLADFVGSVLTPQQLCCLSRSGAEDLGQSDRGIIDPFATIDEAVGSDPSVQNQQQVDPRNFNNIRKRFARFVPMSKSIAHAVSIQQANKQRRQLLQLEGGPLTNFNSIISHFKYRGKFLETNNEPGNENNFHHPLGMVSDHGRGVNIQGGVVPDLSDVARMQKILESRRAAEGKNHHHKQIQSPQEVMSRYGKWMKLLHSDPGLLDRLHKEGKESLALFGYNPPKQFMDLLPHPEMIPECHTSVLSCSKL